MCIKKNIHIHLKKNLNTFLIPLTYIYCPVRNARFLIHFLIQKIRVQTSKVNDKVNDKVKFL
jgi:hypothetical protein